ncbi:MAG: amino acid racemase [Legionellales bacterium]|nr:amino acid racemase [Legionellales bacterium]
MKVIGIIGGLSYESTSQYYLDINKISMKKLGGYNKLEIIIISVNLDDIMAYANKDEWHKITSIFINTAMRLEKMGADFIVIPCNSFHIVADNVQQAVNVPILNIIDCVGSHIQALGFSKIALLGSKFTMENEFYHQRLHNHFNILTMMPDAEERDKLHSIILNELCLGIFLNKSKNFVKKLCKKMREQYGCQAIILGCTELPMILHQDEINIPLVPTTDVHAEYIVKFAMKTEQEELQRAFFHYSSIGGYYGYSRIL